MAIIGYWVNHPSLFPSVVLLFKELGSMLANSKFYISLGTTIFRGIIGFGIALLSSSLLASIAFHSKFWKSFFHPIIVLSRSTPVISIVLIALLLMSPRGLPIFIAFFTMFPILYQNILSGLEHTDQRLVEMAKVYKKNNLQRITYIYFPSSRNYFFAGLATAMGFGWRSVIIGEVLATPIHGIGSGMKKAQAFIEMKELLAWTIIAISVSFIFDYIIKSISEKTKTYKLKPSNTPSKKKNLNIDNKEIIISNINLSFNKKVLFSNLNYHFRNNKIHVFKSASGSGKTSLLNLIANIIKSNSGNIEIQPKSAILSYAFQDLRLLPWMKVEENIAFSLPGFPHISSEEKQRLNNLIKLLQLEKHTNKYPNELSGGEQQRVNLARALILEADILLLDEALNGLDQTLKSISINTIEEQTRRNNTLVLWASHDNIDKYIKQPYYIWKLS